MRRWSGVIDKSRAFSEASRPQIGGKSMAGKSNFTPDEPKLADVYISVRISREADESGRGVGLIIRSALFGLASAAAVVVLVALALLSSPLVGFLSAVAMF